MVDKEILFMTESLRENDKQVEELKTDISIRVQASSFPEGTGEYKERLISESSFPIDNVHRRAVSFKQWEGTIVSIENENRFIAKVQDVEGIDLPKFIRFDSRKVEFENGSMFAEGATFFWKVGLFYNDKGMATKRSIIRFRMLPPPNPYLLKVAEEEMNRIFEMLSWID